MRRQTAGFMCAPTADAILAPSLGRSGRGPGRAACACRCRVRRRPASPRPPRSITQSAQASHQLPGCSVAAGEPLLRIRPGLAAGPVVRLRVAGRVDQARDVPGVAEHERAVAAEQLGRPVAALPRREVVGDRAGDEGRHLDPRRGRPACRARDRPPGLASRLSSKMSRNCAVQRAGQVGAVGVPGEDVERRRLVGPSGSC